MIYSRVFLVLAACTLAFGLAACGGMSGTPPTIITQPQSQTVAPGTTVTFTVAASGSMPLSYQWMENGTAIPGATSSSYTTPPVTLSDNNAQFAVVVSNGSGTVTSAAATLRVIPVP